MHLAQKCLQVICVQWGLISEPFNELEWLLCDTEHSLNVRCDSAGDTHGLYGDSNIKIKLHKDNTT